MNRGEMISLPALEEPFVRRFPAPSTTMETLGRKPIRWGLRLHTKGTGLDFNSHSKNALFGENAKKLDSPTLSPTRRQPPRDLTTTPRKSSPYEKRRKCCPPWSGPTATFPSASVFP